MIIVLCAGRVSERWIRCPKASVEALSIAISTSTNCDPPSGGSGAGAACRLRQVLAGNDDYVIDHSTSLTIIGPDHCAAVQVAIAEPYLIAAKLIEVLDKGGVPLGNVNNLRAWR